MQDSSSPQPPKAPLTPAQKRLLGLVIALGGVLLVMFVFVMGVIVYQIAHLP